jgi:2-oxoglutarate dehydrogenase E1 component
MADDHTSATSLGPNAWLVDEKYEQYRADPASVSESWREFFADYKRDIVAPPTPAAPAPVATTEAVGDPLRGAAARVVANMETSLGVPTATSFRQVPAKLLEVNRRVINGYLSRTRGGKVSFTHLIGFAVVRAIAESVPAMNAA